jgi:phosphoglycerol geranylgeranyltransferase
MYVPLSKKLFFWDSDHYLYMNNIYNRIVERSRKKEKSFSWLIDPDKCNSDILQKRLKIAKQAKVDYIFIGGSLLVHNGIGEIIRIVKSETDIPAILFPGNTMQVSENADGILFLSLISGRNPDYLIGRHVEIAPILKSTGIEVIPTGYMLVDTGNPTTVSYISNTTPIPYNKTDIAVSTAIAGELLGLKLIFLEGGSGASIPVSSKMIEGVKANINIPLIVGGGIRTTDQLKQAFSSGADIVVIGNIIEENEKLISGFAEIAQQYIN